MKQQIESIIEKIKPKYSDGNTLYFVSVLFTAIGIRFVGFLFVGVPMLLFSLSYLYRVRKRIKMIEFIEKNYDNDLNAVMDVIIDEIQDINRSISIDTNNFNISEMESKIDTKSKERKRTDWIRLKESIITYHKIK